ncbi:hypothetical protein A3Q56_05689 [Intoshia linei]|uniref:Uncharacterized protein n=1 Tax=Intoshia linei TaxID=1819745 RepID=A0A177AX66_9BILA|nr:hypothetical protein A3Q56_05689 [Intoshia linei]
MKTKKNEFGDITDRFNLKQHDSLLGQEVYKINKYFEKNSKIYTFKPKPLQISLNNAYINKKILFPKINKPKKNFNMKNNSKLNNVNSTRNYSKEMDSKLNTKFCVKPTNFYSLTNLPVKNSIIKEKNNNNFAPIFPIKGDTYEQTRKRLIRSQYNILKSINKTLKKQKNDHENKSNLLNEIYQCTEKFEAKINFETNFVSERSIFNKCNLWLKKYVKPDSYIKK